MQDAPCPACQSDKIAGTHDVPDHEYAIQHVARYAECAECGTLFQQPMPRIDELAHFYPARYHSFTAKGLLPRLKHRSRLKRLASFVRTADAVVLDYGCGDGGFIKAAAESVGWTFWGFEIGLERRKEVSNAGRVTIVRGSLDDLIAGLPMCDLITMNHVIEHLPDPVATLSALRDRLKDGAILEGQTPAADSLERRVFGTAWSGFHAPRHTVIFSQRGLSQALARAQFSGPIVCGAFNPAGIAVSLASATHGDGGGTVRRQGPAWLACLGAATALYPVDRLSGAPGIVNYTAFKAVERG